MDSDFSDINLSDNDDVSFGETSETNLNSTSDTDTSSTGGALSEAAARLVSRQRIDNARAQRVVEPVDPVFTPKFLEYLRVIYAATPKRKKDTDPARAAGDKPKKYQRKRKPRKKRNKKRRAPMTLENQRLIVFVWGQLMAVEMEVLDRHEDLFNFCVGTNILLLGEVNNKECRDYLQRVIKNRVAADESGESVGSFFDNGFRSRYPQLEEMMHNFIKLLPFDLPIGVAFLRTLSRVLLHHRLGDHFCQVYGLGPDSTPSERWHVDILTGLGYRILTRSGERALVDEERALKEMPKLWRSIRGVSKDKIFNADQTCIEVRDPKDFSLYSKADFQSKSKKKSNLTFTLMLCCNMTGSIKMSPWLFMHSLKPRWLDEIQRFYNPTFPSRAAAKERAARDPGVIELQTKYVALREERDRLDAERAKKHHIKQVLEQMLNDRIDELTGMDEDDMEVDPEIVDLSEQIDVAEAEWKDFITQRDAKREETSMAYSAYTIRKDELTDEIESTRVVSTLEHTPESDLPGIGALHDKHLRLPEIKEMSAASLEVASLIKQLKAPGTQAEKREIRAKLTTDLYWDAAHDDELEDPATGPLQTMKARAIKQEKGYMDTRAMVQWLVQFAVESGAGPLAEDRVVLIVDNVGFHHNAHRIIKAWKEQGRDLGIDMFFLPPNSTPYTQPMDLGIIGTVKANAKLKEKNYVSHMDAFLATGEPGEVQKFAASAAGNGKCSYEKGEAKILHRINFLFQAWQELPVNTIQVAFGRSPAFHEFDLPRPTLIEERLRTRTAPLRVYLNPESTPQPEVAANEAFDRAAEDERQHGDLDEDDYIDDEAADEVWPDNHDDDDNQADDMVAGIPTGEQANLGSGLARKITFLKYAEEVRMDAIFKGSQGERGETDEERAVNRLDRELAVLQVRKNCPILRSKRLKDRESFKLRMSGYLEMDLLRKKGIELMNQGNGEEGARPFLQAMGIHEAEEPPAPRDGGDENANAPGNAPVGGAAAQPGPMAPPEDREPFHPDDAPDFEEPYLPEMELGSPGPVEHSPAPQIDHDMSEDLSMFDPELFQPQASSSSSSSSSSSFVIYEDPPADVNSLFSGGSTPATGSSSLSSRSFVDLTETPVRKAPPIPTSTPFNNHVIPSYDMSAFYTTEHCLETEATPSQHSSTGAVYGATLEPFQVPNLQPPPLANWPVTNLPPPPSLGEVPNLAPPLPRASSSEPTPPLPPPQVIVDVPDLPAPVLAAWPVPDLPPPLVVPDDTPPPDNRAPVIIIDEPVIKRRRKRKHQPQHLTVDSFNIQGGGGPGGGPGEAVAFFVNPQQSCDHLRPPKRPRPPLQQIFP